MNFPELQEVIEDIYIYGRSSGTQNLQTIGFPALQKVGGNFTISYWRRAESVAMPKLETVAALSLGNCTALAEVDFRALRTVNGNLTPNLTALAEVTFPALETVTGNISFPASATLTALQFPVLKLAGGLTIPNTTNLATLQFPMLKTVTGELSVQLQSLTSLDAFSALDSIGGRLYLYNLANLTSLGLPELESAGTVYAYGLTKVTGIDVRGIEIGSLELYGTTMTGLTVIGDEEFSGKLYIGNPPSGTTGFPITIHGFKKVGALQVAASYLTAIDFPWLESVTGLLNFSSGSAVKTINLPNLKSAGGIQISYYNALETLSLPGLETVTGYTSGTTTVGFTYALSSSNITTVELPKLKSIKGNLSITGLIAARKLATISFPELESLTGTLTITGTSNTKFKDLGGFSKLTSAAGVTISNFTNLKDFCPLKNAASSFAVDKWSVKGCGYSPTHQSMVDGNCSQ
jgi:hypothetical protein